MKILLLGINGKMGGKIYQSLKEYKFYIEGFDTLSHNEVNTISDIKDVNPKKYDWLVDFSEANISMILTELFLKNGVNVISGTTGISLARLNEYKKLAIDNNAKYIHRVNFSSNFCAYENLVKAAANLLPNKCIVESHDISKLDKPSGSAIRLAKAINIEPCEVISLRIDEPEPYHKVIFSNDEERIILIHQVLDKKAFKEGFMEVFLKEAGVK